MFLTDRVYGRCLPRILSKETAANQRTRVDFNSSTHSAAVFIIISLEILQQQLAFPVSPFHTSAWTIRFPLIFPPSFSHQVHLRLSCSIAIVDSPVKRLRILNSNNELIHRKFGVHLHH